jgi:hypothetical protein
MFFFFLPFSLSLVEAQEYNISDCSVIDQSGKYILVNDINSNVSTCINIIANNVVLDCQGHSIIAYEPIHYETAISVNGSYISILNCSIGGIGGYVWVYGIKTYFNINISYLYVNSTNYGIFGGGSNNVRVEKSYIESLNLGITASWSGWYVNNVTLKSANIGVEIDGINSVFANLYITGAYYGFVIFFTNGNQIVNNTVYGVTKAIADYGGYENYIFNNIFNVTSAFIYGSDFSEYWNTTLTAGTNIIGGPYIGGNYWGKIDGTGYSDTCSDNNNDGICDDPYNLTSDGSNIDYLPLTKYTGGAYISVTFSYSSVDFGTLQHNTTDNPAPDQFSGIYNVSVDTNANYVVKAYGNDFSPYLSISNLRFDTNSSAGNLDASQAVALSTSPQTIDTYPPTTIVNYHGYWLSIPYKQYASTYTTTVTVNYETA